MPRRETEMGSKLGAVMVTVPLNAPGMSAGCLTEKGCTCPPSTLSVAGETSYPPVAEREASKVPAPTLARVKERRESFTVSPKSKDRLLTFLSFIRSSISGEAGTS